MKLAIYALAVNDNKVWAIGEKGNYLVSTDGGYTWKTITDVIKTRKWTGMGFRDRLQVTKAGFRVEIEPELRPVSHNIQPRSQLFPGQVNC